MSWAGLAGNLCFWEGRSVPVLIGRSEGAFREHGDPDKANPQTDSNDLSGKFESLARFPLHLAQPLLELVPGRFRSQRRGSASKDDHPDQQPDQKTARADGKEWEHDGSGYR